MRRNSKKNKKVRNLVLVSVLSAILLTVSTYAWFIGMKTVKVSEFQVEIATTEGLFLSMDGENWKYKLTNEDLANAYEGNANQWLEGTNEGLFPVSTVGDMDATTSRMMLYEKGSLTTTDGGYRLMASRVNNYDEYNEGNVTDTGEYLEGDGYVAFDLFIKNLSGNEYYPKNEVANEEAIYLTYDSKVEVGSSGAANSGIENSVRVAFAQIARVKADSEVITTNDVITMNCAGTQTDADNPSEDEVTGICREATIWEPNDTDHVDNAINWYNTSCKKRTGTAGTNFTYAATDNACKTVVQDVAEPTYAIANEIFATDYVDVYDGKEFNYFEGNTITYDAYSDASYNKEDALLVDYPYYTDTMKKKSGNERIQFMTLAPNSITKVRVYVYLEGQDIDNYDFAQLGKQISVKFGFTKERYVAPDGDNSVVDGFDYNGPTLVTGDDNA